MKSKISLFVAILFCFYCSLVTKESCSSTDEDNLRIGIELFESGQFQHSYIKLLEAFDNNPGNTKLNFYLGRAAFEIGNYEMAVMSFERILITSPDEHRVKLEIARAFQRLGANDIARQYCTEVLSAEPPEAVKKNIKKFLIYIDKTEQKHFLNGQFIVGVDWNNNIWASPSVKVIETVIGDVNLTGASSSKTQDWIYNSTLWVDHTYPFHYSNYFWKTHGTFYKAIYDETTALNIRYLGGDTGPAFRSGNNTFGFRLLLNQIELGNTEYLKGVGVKAKWDRIISPNLVTNAALKYETKDFPGNSDMDSENKSLLLGLHFLLGKSMCHFGLKSEKENAFDDEFSYTRYGSNLSLTYNLPFHFTGSSSYNYQYSHYDKAAALFTKKRQDHLHSAGLSLEKKMWTSLLNPDHSVSCRLTYQHTWSYSNIELYEYTKDFIQLFFIYNF
ncbi:surface lipoprotein assembly modifier [Desulfobacterales bacterium HSG17]|nr:surface lipoprotein assembly modifier [Desulfobacterales bacterium HSG17]